MEEAFRSFLLGRSGLSALGGRIDWGLRPKRDALPAMTLTVVSGPRTNTYTATDDLIFYRVQADLWGADYGTAKRAARAAIAALDDLATVPGFSRPSIDNETDGTEPDASGQPVSRTRLELRLPYTAS